MDPRFDPEARYYENMMREIFKNEARRKRQEARRKRIKQIKNLYKAAKRAVRGVNFRECSRCGERGRGKTFGNKRTGPRICLICWRGMTQIEKQNVKRSGL